MAFVDLGKQQARIRDRIDAAIARVLDHGQYIMGPEVKDLERLLAVFTGARHVISCASGTDALLIAMMALGVGRGDAVLCPAFTYTATPETIALLGADPVFVDVDRDSFNLDPSHLVAGFEKAKAKGLRPVGIIAVDLFGLPAEYAAIESFASSNDMFVLADGAQSFGASRGNRLVGKFGKVTATSFFPAKPLGCYGDGGALFTDDDDLASLIRSVRLHGKAQGANKYDIERIGVNGRLDTMQAAILLEKLEIFGDEIKQRDRIAQRYSAALSGAVNVPIVPSEAQSTWAQYTIRVEAEQRDKIVARLKSDGIPTAIYYPKPLHKQTAYRNFPVADAGVATAERLSNEVLSIPIHPYLLQEQQDQIVSSLRKAIGDC